MLLHVTYMSTKLLLPTKTSDSKSLLKCLHMNTSALVKCNHAGTCIQHPRKKSEFGHTLSCCICRNCSSEFYPYPTFYMSQCHGIPRDHISRWHLVENCRSIFNAPTFFCIYVNQAIARIEFLWGLILLVAFSDCPSFTFVVSFSFHGKMCNSALGLVPLQPSLLPPMVGFISSQARVLLLCPYV
jgi:hypothetical protein